MVNDRFGSVAANDGSGFTIFNRFFLRVTNFFCETDYLVRTLNGKRVIKLKSLADDREYDLLKDSKDMVFEVTTGAVTYKGSMEDIQFNIEIFVPNNDPCECWTVTLSGNGDYLLTVSEELAFTNHRGDKKLKRTILPDGMHHIPIERYREDIERICDTLRLLFPKAKMIFATFHARAGGWV